jgi:predicted metal-dependent phosphoesterase TrpH
VHVDLHVHTQHSIDSRITPKNLIKAARLKGLHGIAVTDHNTIRGGQDTKSHSQQDLLVIVGSEIKTTICEIIGLFLQENIDSTDPYKVLEAIRDQNGISVLPHPYRYLQTTSFPQDFLHLIDVIEGYNSRTPHRKNRQAVDLASRMNKPICAGSDAHFYQELGRATTIFPDIAMTEDTIRKALLNSKVTTEIIGNNYLRAAPYIVLSGVYSRIRHVFDSQ